MPLVKNNCGRLHFSQRTRRDIIATAQLYPKEIENNTENVQTILDAAYTAPAMADLTLLSHLA